jgi:hypothetical protein
VCNIPPGDQGEVGDPGEDMSPYFLEFLLILFSRFCNKFEISRDADGDDEDDADGDDADDADADGDDADDEDAGGIDHSNDVTTMLPWNLKRGVPILDLNNKISIFPFFISCSMNLFFNEKVSSLSTFKIFFLYTILLSEMNNDPPFLW